jgi:hypothetical protein
MGFSDRHEENDCDCVKYQPEFKIWEVRLNGINLLCRKCNRYVDPTKWKGGLVEKKNYSRGYGTIMVMISQIFCPCCGRKMTIKRKNKKKLEDSIRHQIKYPELHDSRARKSLKKKVKLLESNVLAPRVA